MTSRNLYEGVLIELNKENAPNILLEDFNYFANKAINNYINKRYNIYDINQQTTDDLRVLKATALLTPRQVLDYSGLTMAGDSNIATYEVIMPSDYLHILNCICIYQVKKTYKCYNAGDTWRASATRLTADMYSLVLDNFWNKPTYKRPYYYIHNVNTSNFIPTNPYGKGNTFDQNERLGFMDWYDKNINLPSTNLGTSSESDELKFYTIGTSKILYILYKGELHKLTTAYGYIIYNNGSSILLVQPVSNSLYGTSQSILLDYLVDGLSFLDNKPIARKDGDIYYLLDEYSVTNVTSDSDIPTSSSSGSSSSSTGSSGSETLDLGTDVSVLSDSSDNKRGISTYQGESYGLDGNGKRIVQGKGLPNTIIVSGTPISNVERGQAIRYGNVSLVRLEIRYGQ